MKLLSVSGPLTFLILQLGARTRATFSDQADVQFFNREAGDLWEDRLVQRGDRDVLQAPANVAEQMLVWAHVRVEASDCAGRADSSNQLLVFQKLESPIDGGLRQTGQLLAQPAVNRLRRRMRKVFRQRPVDRQTLRGNSSASRAAKLFKFRAPNIYLVGVTARLRVAVNYHVRIIII